MTTQEHVNALLPTRLLTGSPSLRFAWALLIAWASLLGLQLIEIQRFRVAPSDVVLGALAVTMAIRERTGVLAVIRKWTPVHTALFALLAALAWGSAIAVLRTGVLVQDAWLNKDVGWLVLALTYVCVHVLVRSADDVRTVLRALLVGGTVTTWLAVAWTVATRIASNGSGDLRFQGFLLNPSAEAVYLSVLIVVQVASAYRRGIVDWPTWLQRLNALALIAVLLTTLSRSSWVATLVTLGIVGIFSVQRTRFPLALACALLLFVGAPLIESIRPVAYQVAGGQEPTTLRERTPVGSPPLALQELASAIPTKAPGAQLQPTSRPSDTPVPTATAQGLESFVTGASAVASEQYGASDRLALNVIGIRLWLSSPSTAVTGIGNGVFLQLSPYTAIGASLAIHSTYVWLPVEMGLPGIAALLAFIVAAIWAVRGVVRLGEFDLVIVFLGIGVLFAVWIGINEGLYQRTLWLMLSLATVIATAGRRRTDGEAG